jgi:polyhydroxyalkanoate synthesis regulator phasin
MIDEQKADPPTDDSTDDGAAGTGSDGAEQSGSTNGSSGSAGRQNFGDGIKQGIGVLAAFKDALEETIQEARERGDLSSEKAREVMKDAMDRAQTAAEGARERLDFATQTELRSLREAVDDLMARVATLEAAAGIDKNPADSATSSESASPEAEG